MKALRYFLWFVIALVAIDIALNSRSPATFELWPLPAITLPLYRLLFVTLIVGGVLGVFGSWLARATKQPKIVTKPEEKPTTPGI